MRRPRRTVVDFDIGRVEKLAGLALPEKQIRAHARRRSASRSTARAPKVKVTVPSWRPDIHGAADLVEEVVRIAGLDKVPSAPMPRVSGVARAGADASSSGVSRRARRVLAARGMVEAITWSFIPRAQAQHFGGGSDALELANPISSEMSSMRPSLLPGLLAAVAAQPQPWLRRRRAVRGRPGLPRRRAGGSVHRCLGRARWRAQLTGSGRHWGGARQGGRPVRRQGRCRRRCWPRSASTRRKAQITRDAPAWFHPGRSGTLRLGPKVVLAHFGELHPDDAEGAGRRRAGVRLRGVPRRAARRAEEGRARPALAAADLLPVRRDFAFVLDRTWRRAMW